MNRERTLLTTINVDRQGQMFVFQVKIPRDIKNIIGVELGVRFKTLSVPDAVYTAWPPIPLIYNRNNTVGDIKLQSLEEGNLFYTEELKLDNNLPFADFSFYNLFPTAPTHSPSMNEVAVKVDSETTVLKGIYKDKFGEAYSSSGRSTATYTYAVNVYVWVERKEKEGVNK